MRFTHQRTTRLAAIAAASAAILALAGCSSAAPEQGTSTASGPVTLSWWTWNPDEKAAVQYIKAFEAEHPDITIKHRYITYSDYVNATQLALKSGSGPDVFGLQVGALTNQFAPLAEDLTPIAEKALGADWAKALTATDQLAVNGKQVALPWMITGAGLVWANQTLIDGLKLSVPKTSDELAAFCSAVTAAGKSCIVQGAKDSWQNIDVFQTISNQIAPGKFYKALSGETSFDDPTFVQAFDVWKGLFDDGVFQKGALATAAYPDANDAFVKGKAALIVFGSWNNPATTQAQLDQQAEGAGDPAIAKTQFVPYFAPAFVKGGTTGAMFGGPDVGFAISSSSKQKDAAATFVTWLTASEAGQTIMAKNILQPALASVPLDLSAVISDLQRTQLETQGPALGNLIGAREINSADVRTALGDALAAVASGQQSPAAAATSVQAAITAAG